MRRLTSTSTPKSNCLGQAMLVLASRRRRIACSPVHVHITLFSIIDSGDRWCAGVGVRSGQLQLDQTTPRELQDMAMVHSRPKRSAAARFRSPRRSAFRGEASNSEAENDMTGALGESNDSIVDVLDGLVMILMALVILCLSISAS